MRLYNVFYTVIWCDLSSGGQEGHYFEHVTGFETEFNKYSFDVRLLGKTCSQSSLKQKTKNVDLYNTSIAICLLIGMIFPFRDIGVI